MQEHHLPVPRTARYHTLGDAAQARAIWIVLHGHGQLARYFLRKFEGLEDGRFIAAPEGLSRFYTDEAHSRVGATWMTREDREHEIADQATYLDLLANALLRDLSPGTPLNLLGFSQGVATACRWSLCTAFPIKRMVLWAGSLPPMQSPAERGPWRDMDIHLVLGTDDPYADDSALSRQSALLHEAAVAHRVHRFPGGHELDRGLLEKLMANGNSTMAS